ncbi:MAG: protein kinase domain-containing protein, partial [Thermoanaerobaculia bacterium]
MNLAPGTRLGRFEIRSLLGAGGMGEVYRARDLDLGREVAIKVLPADVARDPERLKRLEREAKALAALNHPNTLTIHSIEQHGDIRFLSMELVEGTSLDRIIPPTGLALDSFFAIALPLCEGLSAAHERNIIHRDLKPANVMVTTDRRVKILDFGLAKLQTSVVDIDTGTDVLTSAGAVFGTAPYMSPEQLQGRTLDARSDIFSLGVMLYEMATGRRPFEGFLRDTPAPITEIRPDLPDELQEIIARALARSAGARYANAAEVRRALERLHRPPAVESGETSQIRSIAVMPLDNLSRDPAQEYFAEGMTEALITDLAKVTGLKVIARMSVMRFKGSQKPPGAIARELSVDAIVEGSVIAVGQKVRVTAQLIDGRSERHLWAERYDREMHDVLLLQDELVRSIASEVKAKVLRESKGPRRVDPEVYRLDLRGRHHWNKRSEA